MPLRKSPVRTPAMLAANRANAPKCTGPRTARGKARVSFNSFKHGRYAARPEELAERLLRAECHREAALYRQVRWQIGQVFRPKGDVDWNRLHRLSARVWCFRTGLGRAAGKSGAKPETSVFSCEKESRVSSTTRIQVEDPYRRIGVVFWVQRRRYSSPKWIGRVRLGLDRAPAVEEPGRLEGGLRCRVFRMRKPRNWDERFRYGLDREGNFRPELYLEYRRALRGARSGNR